MTSFRQQHGWSTSGWKTQEKNTGLQWGKCTISSEWGPVLSCGEDCVEHHEEEPWLPWGTRQKMTTGWKHRPWRGPSLNPTSHESNFIQGSTAQHCAILHLERPLMQTKTTSSPQHSHPSPATSWALHFRTCGLEMSQLKEIQGLPSRSSSSQQTCPSSAEWQMSSTTIPSKPGAWEQWCRVNLPCHC